MLHKVAILAAIVACASAATSAADAIKGEQTATTVMTTVKVDGRTFGTTMKAATIGTRVATTTMATSDAATTAMATSNVATATTGMSTGDLPQTLPATSHEETLSEAATSTATMGTAWARDEMATAATYFGTNDAMTKTAQSTEWDFSTTDAYTAVTTGDMRFQAASTDATTSTDEDGDFVTTSTIGSEWSVFTVADIMAETTGAVFGTKTVMAANAATFGVFYAASLELSETTANLPEGTDAGTGAWFGLTGETGQAHALLATDGEYIGDGSRSAGSFGVILLALVGFVALAALIGFGYITMQRRMQSHSRFSPLSGDNGNYSGGTSATPFRT